MRGANADSRDPMTESRTGAIPFSHLVLAALLLLGAAACGPPADARNDAPGAAGAADSGDTADLVAASSLTPPRLAIDATLSLLTAGPLSDAIGAAADSFGLREAVRIVHDTVPYMQFAAEAPSRDVTADIVALTEGVLVSRLVEREQATWYLRFAGNRIVVAWGDSSRHSASVDTTGWWKVLLRRDARVGRADPALDPLGVNTLIAMRLAERATGERQLATRLLAASPPSRLHPNADSLTASLRAGALDYIWTYESAAQHDGLRYVSLGRSVDLGDDAMAERYASTTVSIPPRERADSVRAASDTTDSVVVRGVPIRYSLSIPRRSINPAVAERFIRFLFSEEGRRILQRGDVMLLDRLVAVGSGIPAAVAAVSDSVAAVDLGTASDSVSGMRLPR